MSFNLKRMTESKNKFRHELAKRPLAEKLAMLDELRERALVLRKAAETLPLDIRQKARAKSQSGSDGEKRSKR